MVSHRTNPKKHQMSSENGQPKFPNKTTHVLSTYVIQNEDSFYYRILSDICVELFAFVHIRSLSILYKGVRQGRSNQSGKCLTTFQKLSHNHKV